MHVYLIQNKLDGRKYVGQSVNDPLKRIRRHFIEAVHPTRLPRYAFGRAIRKHGADSFEFSVLEECLNIASLNLAEIRWIAHHDCVSPSGYNLTEGGGNFGVPTQATLQKRSAAMTGKKFGPISEERRENISLAKTGVRAAPMSEETRSKLSESNKKNKLWMSMHSEASRLKGAASRTGQKRGPPSEETKRRISEARKGQITNRKPHSEETKKKLSEAHKRRTSGYCNQHTKREKSNEPSDTNLRH